MSFRFQLFLNAAIRLLELLLLILIFKDTLETDARLDIDDLNLSVIRRDVGFSMSFILSDGGAVNLWVFKHALMKYHELAIKAGVDFQVL